MLHHSVADSLFVLALVASCSGRGGIRVIDGSRAQDLAGFGDAALEGSGLVEDASVDVTSADASTESGMPDSGVADGPGCQPVTCDPQGGQYCGRIGDDCGGTLDCGDCRGSGLLCGVCRPHVCSRNEGVLLSCDSPVSDVRYCGQIDDGLGCPLSCGDCPLGQTCGGGGFPGVCGSEACPSNPTCSPADAQSPPPLPHLLIPDPPSAPAAYHRLR